MIYCCMCVEAFAKFYQSACNADLSGLVLPQVQASNEPGIVAFAFIAPSRACEEQHIRYYCCLAGMQVGLLTLNGLTGFCLTSVCVRIMLHGVWWCNKCRGSC
jgi:hypothetical protein